MTPSDRPVFWQPAFKKKQQAGKRRSCLPTANTYVRKKKKKKETFISHFSDQGITLQFSHRFRRPKATWGAESVRKEEEEEEEKCARVYARGRHLCQQRRSREEQQRGKTVGQYSFLHILFSFYLTESHDDGFILEPRQRQRRWWRCWK